MDWKKFLRRMLLVLLLVPLGFEACMELRYPCDELSIASRDTEKILRQTPEVFITEEDRALMADLLAVPSVQALVEGGENGDIFAKEDPEVKDVAGKYLGEESAEHLNVSAIFYEDGHEVFLGWRDGKQIFYLQMRPEGDGAAYYKLYSPKRGTSYENWDNQRAQKGVVRRRWFAWLRDGMWKEEE